MLTTVFSLVFMATKKPYDFTLLISYEQQLQNIAHFVVTNMTVKIMLVQASMFCNHIQIMNLTIPTAHKKLQKNKNNYFQIGY